MISRRQFLKLSAAAGAGLAVPWNLPSFAQRRPFFSIPGGSLNPKDVPKFRDPLVIPPAMPSAGGNGNYYEIAVRQFQQQILPRSWSNKNGIQATTIWSYGAVNAPETFNYPAFTLEAKHDQPLTVKWINELVDSNGNYLPHILPVD